MVAGVAARRARALFFVPNVLTRTHTAPAVKGRRGRVGRVRPLAAARVAGEAVVQRALWWVFFVFLFGVARVVFGLCVVWCANCHAPLRFLIDRRQKSTRPACAVWAMHTHTRIMDAQPRVAREGGAGRAPGRPAPCRRRGSCACVCVCVCALGIKRPAHARKCWARPRRTHHFQQQRGGGRAASGVTDKDQQRHTHTHSLLQRAQRARPGGGAASDAACDAEGGFFAWVAVYKGVSAWHLVLHPLSGAR